MDEMAVAQSALESILEEAARLSMTPVAATLSYGMMHGLDAKTLREAFRSACEQLGCGQVLLTTREMPVQIRCRSCGAVSEYELAAPHCGRCGSGAFDFLPEAPVMLEDIEFQEIRADEDKRAQENT